MRAKRMRTTRQQLIEEPATLADRTANGAGADTEPARELALEEALRKMVALYESEYDADVPFKRPDWLVAALSSPDHADAGKVEGDGWMPIESAPKDGTPVLAYQAGRYFKCWLECDQYEGGYFWQDEEDSEPSPTHWHPLPSAPASEGAE